MHRRPAHSAGFTIIELMIVVAIIGILASLAVPAFLYYQMRARRAEQFVNIKAIAVSQMAYYGEYDEFVDCDSSPTTPLDRNAYDFDETRAGWLELGWLPDGDVRCHYSANVFNNSNGQWVRVQSTCDLDNDNQIATWRMDVDPNDTSGSTRHMVLRPNSATASNGYY